MKMMISAIAMAATVALTGTAFAQDVPVGGPTAKGNAPIKQTHTVNDGALKKGATSFTKSEASKHIVHAGYDSVSGLVKGKDGIWRGVAMKGGVALNVGLDFKGNVSEGGPAGGAAATASVSTTGATTSSASTSAGKATSHAAHHHPRTACAHPGVNGVACSGVDNTKNGISDKEDRAISGGAKP